MAQPTPPTPAAPCFYEHTAQSIIPHLASQMPYSSSLVRRIQHGIAHPSSTAKILATFPPGSVPSSSSSSSSCPGLGLEPSTPWLAASVDLFRGRETQIILYSSLEAESTSLPLIAPVAVSPSDPSRYPGPAADANANANASGPATLQPHPHASTNNIVPAGAVTPGSEENKAPLRPAYSVSTLSASAATLDTARAQLLAFLAYVKAHLLPEYLASLPNTESGSGSGPSASVSASPSAGVTLIPPPDPRAFLIGSFHTGLFELLLRLGRYPLVEGEVTGTVSSVEADPLPGLRIRRFDNPPYYKYFFTRAVFSPAIDGARSTTQSEAENALPTGYRFHDRRGRIGVLPSQLDLVQSRTHIPRPRRQLESLPSVAVYRDEDPSEAVADGNEDDEMPIAWAFLGVDGAVATLHVEPEHRGRGLALQLSKEVMRRGMAAESVFGAKGVGIVDEEMRGLVEDWVHAEVAGYNKASRRVMEKIGGRVLTTVLWTVIEMTD